MSIFEKIQKIKCELLDCNLKKSGHNKFAGYDYYELSDLMPDIIRLCEKHNLCTKINFFENRAELVAIDYETRENPEKTAIECPTAELQIKGANAIQALGGVQTYVRRYLYMALFDITENDQFDATIGHENPNNTEVFRCHDCGTEFREFVDKNGAKYTAKTVFTIAKKRGPDGNARCSKCLEKLSKS